MPRAVGELRARGCQVELDDGVVIEGSESHPPPIPEITLETIVPIVTANSDIDDIGVLRRWHKWSPKLQSKWPRLDQFHFEPSGLPEADFIPSEKFLGQKRGYVYDLVGARGVGYYLKHIVYREHNMDNEIMELDSSMQGVTLSGNRVTQLEFNGWQLGMVPAEIGRLTALTVLRLSGNQLKTLPAEIGQLTSLEKLSLYNNRLTSVPAWIGQLRSLQALFITGNELTSLPVEIVQLRSLRELFLGCNQLTSLPAWIGHLTSLERLTLENNQLTSLPAEIGQLTALTMLSLGGNQLTSLPPGIGRLTSLKKLLLDVNKLTSLPAEIGQMVGLEELNLRGNPLKHFEVITALKRYTCCKVYYDGDIWECCGDCVIS